jgi:hypothetical protein
MRKDDLVIIWSARLFQIFLVLYPGRFRRDYGREMTLVFRDTCRQAQHCHGTMGILELWLTTLLDLFSTALAERLSEVYQMSSTAMFTRVSGLVAAVGGVLLLILVYGDFVLDGIFETLAYVILMLVYGLGIAIGVAGFYVLGQYESSGRLGLGLAFLGGVTVSASWILMFLFESETWWTIWIVGMALSELGLVIFGWSAFKHRLLPRWNSLPLVAGGLALAILIAGIANLLFGSENRIYVALWLAANGLGWVALGALLMLGDKRAAYNTGAAA